MTQPQVDTRHLKTLQVIAHQTEQLFNKDQQISELVQQTQALAQAYQQVKAELDELKDEGKTDKQAPKPESPAADGEGSEL